MEGWIREKHVKHGSTINNKTGSIPQQFSLKHMAYHCPKDMYDKTFLPLPTSVISSPDPTVSCEEVLQQLRIHSFWNDLLTHPGKQNQQTKLTEELWSRCQKQLEVFQPFTLPNERTKSQTQYIGGVPANREVCFRKIRILSILFKMTHFFATSRTTTLLYSAVWTSTVLLFKRRTCAT